MKRIDIVACFVADRLVERRDEGLITDWSIKVDDETRHVTATVRMPVQAHLIEVTISKDAL